MTEEDIGVFFAANPATAATVWSVLEALQEQSPCYPADVIRAAVEVSRAAGELMSCAASVDCHDTPRNRENMLSAATKAAAESLRFLIEIGNLKGQR
ncbi:hypothetical protein R80B4_00933 [Fibrobacteres bacterium R8-0-B4]